MITQNSKWGMFTVRKNYMKVKASWSHHRWCLHPANCCPLSQRGCCQSTTHRKVSVEIVFPVKIRLLIYGAVESQSSHHCSFNASPVQHLEMQEHINLDRKIKQLEFSTWECSQGMCQVKTHQKMTPESWEELRSEQESQRTVWCWS